MLAAEEVEIGSGRAAAGRPGIATRGVGLRLGVGVDAALMTLALAEVLMNTFAHDLSSIELVPWFEGSFEVSVNGNLVHSMYRDGGFPEHETIIDAVRVHLAEAATNS